MGNAEVLKRDVGDGVFVPVLVIEMPPFGFVDGKTFRFHGPAEQITMPPLQRDRADMVALLIVEDLKKRLGQAGSDLSRRPAEVEKSVGAVVEDRRGR